MPVRPETRGRGISPITFPAFAAPQQLNLFTRIPRIFVVDHVPGIFCGAASPAS